MPYPMLADILQKKNTKISGKVLGDVKERMWEPEDTSYETMSSWQGMEAEPMKNQ